MCVFFKESLKQQQLMKVEAKWYASRPQGVNKMCGENYEPKNNNNNGEAISVSNVAAFLLVSRMCKISHNNTPPLTFLCFLLRLERNIITLLYSIR